MISQVDSYKKLKFWQKALEVSHLIVKLIRKLPSEKVSWVIIDQVLRSSFSVGANIAEGFGRYKGKEYKRFIQIALGSARETEYWLELARGIYPRFTAEIGEALLVNEEVIKMLTATVKSLNKGSKIN